MLTKIAERMIIAIGIGLMVGAVVLTLKPKVDKPNYDRLGMLILLSQ